MAQPRGDQGESEPQGSDLGRYAGLGLQFTATVGLLALAGYWLDGKLGTLPLFLLLGVLLGFLGAMVSIVRQVPPIRGRRRGGRGPSNTG